jgi:hypothetical protein
VVLAAGMGGLEGCTVPICTVWGVLATSRLTLLVLASCAVPVFGVCKILLFVDTACSPVSILGRESEGEEIGWSASLSDQVCDCSATPVWEVKRKSFRGREFDLSAATPSPRGRYSSKSKS